MPEAEADLDKFIELKPTDGTAWVQRGDVHAAANRWPNAVNDYLKARDLDPLDVNAWCKLGYAQLASGDRAGYRSNCQRMLARFSETEDANAASSVAWLAALMPALSEAESEKSTLLRLARLARDHVPENAAALENLGDSLCPGRPVLRGGAMPEASRRHERRRGLGIDMLFPSFDLPSTGQ